jgi:hypothetical protein
MTNFIVIIHGHYKLLYRCLKIREFRIQRVVGKELEKYLGKKIAIPEEDISTLILFNT